MPAALDLQQLVPPDVLYDVPLENDGILKQDCGLAVSVGLGEQNGLMKRSTCTEEQITDALHKACGHQPSCSAAYYDGEQLVTSHRLVRRNHG